MELRRDSGGISRDVSLFDESRAADDGAAFTDNANNFYAKEGTE